jgi:hypothetical protein
MKVGLEMAQVTLPLRQEGFGATSRRDTWWLGPILTLIGLLLFFFYANAIVFFVPGYFEIRQNKGDFIAPNNPAIAPYLAPFHSPLIYDAQSPHAWITQAKPGWWFLPWFSSAVLILIFPAGFRLTCYYYRKAYYRAFWADPPGCAVGEPRKSYWGENHWPLLIQNIHRYFLYAAIVILLFLVWDAIYAFWWPTLDAAGTPTGGHRIGLGLGTVIMWANVVLLTGFTLGCNSLRHLVGGRLNCFSCPNNIAETRGGYKVWRIVSRFNEHHMEWAWLSLFSVGFTDFYIRMCAAGYWTDLRIF